MNELIKILENLVNIKFNNVSKDNNLLITYLTEMFYEAEQIEVIKNKNGFKNLVIGVNTKLNNINNALILSGHMDTISPVNETSIKITNKELFGLGSCDMKSFIAELIYRFKELKNKTFPIIIILTCDEESSVEGIQNVVRFFRKNKINSKFFIIGEPTNSEICISNKGMVDIVVEIEGKEYHSSKPSGGINSIYIASKLCSKIEKLNDVYENLNSPINVSKIEGGLSLNSVAKNCLVYIDYRPYNNENNEKILNKIFKIKNKLESLYVNSKININVKYNLPYFLCADNNIPLQLCNKLNKKAQVFNAWTEAGYLTKIAPNGIIIGAGDLSLAHKEDEFVSFEQLKNYDEIFIQIINLFEQL